MSFSFGFAGDDIEQDANSIFASSNEGASEPALLNLEDYQAKFMSTPMQFEADYEPRLWTLEELLGKSSGVRMSYTQTRLTSGEGVPRRDLYDVKHQLMSQDALSASEEILMGLTNEDLRVATYEGGLKSWECTFDLLELLAPRDVSGYRNVLELGCGTGLPCVLLFQKMLQQAPGAPARKLVLADYNESVLRLVTVPNLVFAWCELQPAATLAALQGPGATLEHRAQELEITDLLISAFAADLAAKNITLQFVSGGWSPQLVTLLSQAHEPFDLVLASETIYSPETLPVFTDTLLGLMTPATEALVAAKRVYFGVGGGIPEFERALDLRKIGYKTVSEETSQGVVRAILQVSL